MAGSLGIYPAYDAPLRVRAAVSASSGGSWPTPSWAITAADDATNKFTISGNYTSVFRDTEGHRFLISGSAGAVHDGVWTVTDSVFSGGNTIITVEEDVTSASASGTITARYFFLLVAWDDPKEEDWHRARYLNQKLSLGTILSTPPTSLHLSRSVEAFAPGAGDDDIITLTWAAPRHLPHHYTVYYQMREPASSGFDIGEIGTKIRPSSGTTQALEIPKWATSAVFGDPTAVTESRWAAVAATSTNTYYEVHGNHAVHLFSFAPYQIFPNGATGNTSGVPLTRFVGGAERTRIPVSSTTASQKEIAYTHGPVSFSGQSVTGGPVVALSLVTGFEPEWRDQHGMSYNGRNVELAYAGGADIGRVVVQCTHGGLSFDDNENSQLVNSGAGSGGEALAYLHKCLHDKIKLLVGYTTSGSEVFTNEGYVCSVERINELGLTAIQANQRIEIELKIESIERSLYEYGEYRISAADTGVNDAGYFTVVGDKRAFFPAGTRFEVRDSTGNDGLYYVRSSSLSSSNTRIYTEGGVIDTTDDGFIRIWDYL
jgi:hypothetical protein